MKKLSIILVLTLTLIMSGCGEETDWEDMSDLQQSMHCAKDENKALTVCVMYYYELEQQTSYTQEEVDEMLDQEFWVEECFDQYCICKVHEEGHDYCTVIANNNAWNEDIDDIELYIRDLEQDLVELEQRIEELEQEDIETNITYTTLAMLDILIYMYDEEVSNGTIFSEEEIAYYELLEIMRAEYINELGGE